MTRAGFPAQPRDSSKSIDQELPHSNSSSGWDVIVIGSGLGGMASATLLAMARKRVLLLERHDVPGGFTHTFKRKGFEWDVGVHYVGQVAHKNAIVRKIFDYLSGGALDWAPLGDVYDRAIIKGKTFDCVAGRDEHIQNLIERFPQDEAGIRAYFDLVRSSAMSSAWFFGEKMMPRFLSRLAGWMLRRRFESFARLKTYDVIRRFTANDELIAILCIQCGDYGLAPRESSFGIHAAVIDHYIEGASYPVGGARSIYETILAVFRKHDGVLRLSADVQNILLSTDGSVTGVRLANGGEIKAPVVISNAGFRNTFTRLLRPDQLPEKFRGEVATTLESVRPSTAHLCLYVGLNSSDANLNLPKHNIWLYDSLDFVAKPEGVTHAPEERRTLTYISFPSAKDPSWAEKRPNKATVQVICACDMDEVARWKNRPWRKRGEEYEAIKEKWSGELLAKLIAVVPQIKDHVAYTELSTPLSTEHFMNYGRGEIYGLEHTAARFASKALRPQTPVKGLFLTGQDIVVVGVGGALYSGVLAATCVLKKSVIVRILFNRKL